MLAESITEPFDSPDWLFEIKWDGYRAVAFFENGKVRLVSRNQNELTARYPELKDMAGFVKAKTDKLGRNKLFYCCNCLFLTSRTRALALLFQLLFNRVQVERQTPLAN